MKALFTFISVFVLSFSQLAWSHTPEKTTDWQAFSKNLVKALATPNEGLQLSAMQQIITYADKLDVDDAVFDIMRFYRDHKNEKVRQLALTTLYKTQNKWAMGFLRLAVRFEKSPLLKRQIYKILENYDG